MTKAEACLWKYVLRARQMKGYQFGRQRPVLNYIADFMSKELRLMIEVDGITHDVKLVNDKHRTDELTYGKGVSKYIFMLIPHASYWAPRTHESHWLYKVSP
jgi:very-short-patch-repair endonuclease